MKTVKTLLIALLALLATGCGTTNTVPITGRQTHRFSALAASNIKSI